MTPTETPLDINTFQHNIGVQFDQQDLLKQALTHRSYLNEHIEDDPEDNERLEFLGDSILEFITTDMLYRRFPEMSEGEMTRLRAALVRTEALAQVASDIQLGEAMLIGKGEANSGGRERDNNLCSVFEAFIGALYLDQGLQAVRDFVMPRLTAMQQDVMDEAIRKDPRSQFQEWSQAHHSITPTYHVVSTSGPEHDKEFTVDVYLEHDKVAQGKGRSKRAAAQAAARAALDKYVNTDETDTTSEQVNT